MELKNRSAEAIITAICVVFVGVVVLAASAWMYHTLGTVVRLGGGDAAFTIQMLWASVVVSVFGGIAVYSWFAAWVALALFAATMGVAPPHKLPDYLLFMTGWFALWTFLVAAFGGLVSYVTRRMGPSRPTAD